MKNKEAIIRRAIRNTPAEYFKQYNLVLALDITSGEWLRPLTYGGGQYSSGKCLYVKLPQNIDERTPTKKEVLERLLSSLD